MSSFRTSLGQPHPPRRTLAATVFRIVVQSVCLFVLVSISRANEFTIDYDTSVGGQIVPKVEDEIQVRGEELQIVIKPMPYNGFYDAPIAPPTRVEVSARYRLYNPSFSGRSPVFAFPILRGTPEEKIGRLRSRAMFENKRFVPEMRRGLRAAVLVDGTTITAEYVPFEKLFAKERPHWAGAVRQWLAQWPEVAHTVDSGAIQARGEAGGSSMEYSRLVDGAANDKTTQTLLRLMYLQAVNHSSIEDWDLDFLSFLNATLHPCEPDSVAQYQSRCGAELSYLDPVSGKPFPVRPLCGAYAFHYDLSRLGRSIDFLQYRPLLPARRETTLEVRYSHLLDADFSFWDYDSPESRNAPVTAQFQYILRTCAQWKSFGPIHVTLAVPCRPRYAISLPMTFQGEKGGYDRYAATLDGSKINQNLLVGILLREGTHSLASITPRQKTALRDILKMCQAHPENPFSDDELYDLGVRLMQCGRPPEGLFELLMDLGIPENEAGPPARLVAARRVLEMVPWERELSCVQSRAQLCFIELMSAGVSGPSMDRAGQKLREIRSMLQDTRGRLEFQDHTIQPALKQEIALIDQWLPLIQTYLAAQPGGGRNVVTPDRWTAFLGELATLEAEARLGLSPSFELSPNGWFETHLEDHPEECRRWLALYEKYQDVQGLDKMLMFLAWLDVRFHSPRWTQNRISQEIHQRIAKAVQTRGLKMPAEHEPCPLLPTVANLLNAGAPR